MSSTVDLDKYLTTRQVAKRLGVQIETVYAYVSRGTLRSVRNPAGRGSLFDPAQVNALVAGDRRRPSGPRDIQGPIVDTSITLIEDGKLFYRGTDATSLAKQGFEATARYVWTQQLDPAPFEAPSDGMSAAKAAVSTLPSRADFVARLQVAAAAAAAVDPMRYYTRGDTATLTAEGLIAVLSQALPVLDAHKSGRSEPGRTSERLWIRLTQQAPDDSLLSCLDTALALLIDHDLAISTVAVRTAASGRTHPYAIALTGMAALEGSLHGAASVVAQSLLQQTLGGDPTAALSDYLRLGQQVPGFGHDLYPQGDPRAKAVFDSLAQIPRSERVLEAVDTLADIVGVEPNIDMALAGLANVAGMPRGAGEVIFALGRTVGWIAHAVEEYSEAPLRFRGQGRYRGDPPPQSITD